MLRPRVGKTGRTEAQLLADHHLGDWAPFVCDKWKLYQQIIF